MKKEKNKEVIIKKENEVMKKLKKKEEIGEKVI